MDDAAKSASYLRDYFQGVFFLLIVPKDRDEATGGGEGSSDCTGSTIFTFFFFSCCNFCQDPQVDGALRGRRVQQAVSMFTYLILAQTER